MEIIYTLSTKEYLQVIKKLSSYLGKYITYYLILLIFGTETVNGIIRHSISTASVISAVIIGVVLMVVVFRTRKRQLLKFGARQGLLNQQTVRIEEDGITVQTQTAEVKHKWTGITGVSEDNLYIYLYLQPVGRAKRAITIPKRVFQDAQSSGIFLGTAQSFYRNHRG